MLAVSVANRGEIPIRIFRTAHELSLHTVAVYSWEDRLSMHRQKADEAYIIGKLGQYTPVGAYLAGDEIIKVASAHDVDLIHPGYGFLSENAEFAENVEKAGIIVSMFRMLALSPSAAFVFFSCFLFLFFFFTIKNVNYILTPQSARVGGQLVTTGV